MLYKYVLKKGRDDKRMLQQRFIELGEGYGDIYELCELLQSNAARLQRTFIFTSPTANGQVLSLAAAFHPAYEKSNFMPIYICREGIRQQEDVKPQRRTIFEEVATNLKFPPVVIEVKQSSQFADPELYYQYLIGILRLNHLIPPLR